MYGKFVEERRANFPSDGGVHRCQRRTDVCYGADSCPQLCAVSADKDCRGACRDDVGAAGVRVRAGIEACDCGGREGGAGGGLSGIVYSGVRTLAIWEDGGQGANRRCTKLPENVEANRGGSGGE